METPAIALLELHVASGVPLEVRTFRVREAVSELFDVIVVARTPDPNIDLEGIVGHAATFRVEIGDVGQSRAARHWSGVCRAVELEQAEPTGLSTYRFHLVPTLWLLTQRRDHRCFQHSTAIQLAAQVLDRFGVDRALDLDPAAYPRLPYKVQYAEADFAFLCRILEEAGVTFTFPPSERPEDRHGVLTLSDRLHAGVARSAALRWVSSPNAVSHELVTDVRVGDETRAGVATLRDHDLRRPGYRLVAEAVSTSPPERALEQYQYRPGGFLVDVAPPTDTPIADRDGAFRHDEEYGRRLAEHGLAGARGDKRVVTYRTNVLDLWPGRVFSIEGHPHPEIEAAPKLLAIEHILEGGLSEPWNLRGRAVLAGTRYYPAMRTARQTARLQSATVIGASEIDTDELGRVLVQFPWDRAGTNTVWVRVSETWAGAGFGLITLPRYGQEVLIDFLEGDPEQPVVVGRMFNQMNPVIDRLPAHQTRSDWKSSSSPGGAGFNEILLEDQKGSEVVYAQAQQDARRLVKHDETSTIVHDRGKLVGCNELETTNGTRIQETKCDRVEMTQGDGTTAVDQTKREIVRRDAVERLECDQVVRVGKDRHSLTARQRHEAVVQDAHLFIGGERPERVGGTDSLIVGHALNESVGSYSVMALGPKAWIHLIGNKKIVLEAPEVTIKQGGGSFLKVDGEITIVGAEVDINDGGSGPGSLPGPGPHPAAAPGIALVNEPIVPKIDPVRRP